MNFFQLAQSSKSKPDSNGFGSPFIKFTPFPQEENNLEKLNDENHAIQPNLQIQSTSGMTQDTKSAFIFNPKKVTFNNAEIPKHQESSIISNMPSMPNLQTNISFNPPIQNTEIKNNTNEEENEYDNLLNTIDEEITNSNLEEQMMKLDKKFKLITSWAQKKMSTLQKLQEDINIASLEGNELLANINSIPSA